MTPPSFTSKEVPELFNLVVNGLVAQHGFERRQQTFNIAQAYG
ncbi:hypothetical protein [Flexibacterium corallicola]|nr:hypothetical protein [Pseudovibrio sp. M1P-2-3]